MRRTLSAALLALVVGVSPLAADRCGIACELARHGGAATAGPDCHHQASPMAGVGATPRVCGFAHAALNPSAVATASSADGRPTLLVLPLPAPPAARPPLLAAWLHESHPPPDRHRTTVSSPLRL